MRFQLEPQLAYIIVAILIYPIQASNFTSLFGHSLERRLPSVERSREDDLEYS